MIDKKLGAALAAALLHAPLATAQAPHWRVVAGEDGRVVTSGMPNGTGRSITDEFLGDAGGELVGLRVTSPDSLAGYWARRSGTFVRYTALGVTGTTGPGRTGTEAGHVFQTILSGDGGASPDGQRLFAARAGEPGSSTTNSYGVWRWDGTRNIEIARAQTDGVLGPGLGAGWRFADASDFSVHRAMNGGTVVLDADLRSPTNASGRAVLKHVPGVGNRACMRAGATEATLAPGLAAGDAFLTGWTLPGDISVTRDGRVYGVFDATNSRGGIWEICAGNPRAIAVDDVPGALGPDLGIDTAYFSNDFTAAKPGLPGHVYFFNYFRRNSGATSEYGLFWHNGSRNRPMAFRDASGYYGPNWGDATWLTFNETTLASNGAYVAFSARVQTTDGGNPTGLWRVRTGQRPELVALIGIPGQYGPEQDRSWASFGAIATLANGTIVVEARTNPGDAKALWALEVGRTPRKLLELGQAITVETTTGALPAGVTSFDIPDAGSDDSRGRDSWFGADGTVLVSATVSTYGEVLLIAQASDRIFRATLD